jgi:hypothetical protein
VQVSLLSGPGLLATPARIRKETRPALSRIRATGRFDTYVHEAVLPL